MDKYALIVCCICPFFYLFTIIFNLFVDIFVNYNYSSYIRISKETNINQQFKSNIMYTITIEFRGTTGCGVYNTENKVVETREFETRKEAKKELRRMKKEEGFKMYGHNMANINKNLEVFRNF